MRRYVSYRDLVQFVVDTDRTLHTEAMGDSAMTVSNVDVDARLEYRTGDVHIDPDRAPKLIARLKALGYTAEATEETVGVYRNAVCRTLMSYSWHGYYKDE